jgi:hypothetical protein
VPNGDRVPASRRCRRRLVRSPTSGSLLRRQLPEQERPFRVPGGDVIPFLAFYASNLIVYWAGWETNWKLFVAVLLGYVVLVVFQRLRRDPGPAMEWRAGLVARSLAGGAGGPEPAERLRRRARRDPVRLVLRRDPRVQPCDLRAGGAPPHGPRARRGQRALDARRRAGRAHGLRRRGPRAGLEPPISRPLSRAGRLPIAVPLQLLHELTLRHPRTPGDSGLLRVLV